MPLITEHPALTAGRSNLQIETAAIAVPAAPFERSDRARREFVKRHVSSAQLASIQVDIQHSFGLCWNVLDNARTKVQRFRWPNRWNLDCMGIH